eukprot:942965-Amphidinium_carterae.1
MHRTGTTRTKPRFVEICPRGVFLLTPLGNPHRPLQQYLLHRMPLWGNERHVACCHCLPQTAPKHAPTPSLTIPPRFITGLIPQTPKP